MQIRIELTHSAGLHAAARSLETALHALALDADAQVGDVVEFDHATEQDAFVIPPALGARRGTGR